MSTKACHLEVVTSLHEKRVLQQLHVFAPGEVDQQKSLTMQLTFSPQKQT